ncbi:MAG: DUF2147 domain-containing protein, partial [Leptospiraceae bacterium]|nr:DUF2147 domain-containing protein [Leptospiraceae bacterium]
NGEIRQCNKCLEEPGSRMLLGFPIIKQLKKVENENKFVGKIYDIQQRKWFDLSITPLTENQIQVRIYAGIPLFGKSFKWERGDNYYKGLISKSPSSIKNKKGIYALTLGDIDAKTEKEVFLRCETIPPFQKERKVYFFTMEGKKSAEGTFLDFIDGQARIQINTKNPNFSQQPSLSVIFFDY